MRSQLTPQAIVLLVSALVLFWSVVGALILRHGHQHRPERPTSRRP